MQADPILYSFHRCPYAMRARMALAVARLRYEVREVSLKAKPLEMLRVSPKATVPVLVLSDGQVIEESLDIMLFALTISDPENWLAGWRPEQKALVRAMMAHSSLLWITINILNALAYRLKWGETSA